MTNLTASYGVFYGSRFHGWAWFFIGIGFGVLGVIVMLKHTAENAIVEGVIRGD